MTLAAMESAFSAAHAAGGSMLMADRLAGIVLVRVAVEAGGCTESDLGRDLQTFAAHRLSAEEWRKHLKELLASLIAAGQLGAHGNRLVASASGRDAAAAFLGLRKSLPASWVDAADKALLAKALGLEKEPPSRLKLLAKPDGLRALIVLGSYGLKIRGAPSPSRLRAALALVALERAFGNQIKHGLGDKSGLAAKPGRILAGQLAKKPKDFGTDARLVAVLAAEAVGAARADAASLRLAVLRHFVAPAAVSEPAPPAKPSRPKTARRALESKLSPAAHLPLAAPPQPQAKPIRPDPASFAREARALAQLRAEGWAGNRKTFISRVWETVQERRPEWRLTEIEFKCMLTEAHRAGLLMLASADLKDKRSLGELQASAISYKNTVWHFIRVDG